MDGTLLRRMTVGDRMRAGIGAVGPRHPKMREYVRNMQQKQRSEPDDPAPEETPEPENDTEDGEAPNLRGAECCGNCKHFDGEENQCTMHDCGCEATDCCDDFKEGNPDTEQGAEMTGEY